MRLSMICIAFALAGCSGVFLAGPLDAGERRELSRARDRWDTHRPADYTYEFRVSCFCPLELNVWSEVTVRGDSVLAVRPLQTIPGLGGSTVPLSSWPTVPRMFAIIEQSKDGGNVRDIRATYDPALGYPTSIDVICKDNIADCGASYEARNLKAGP